MTETGPMYEIELIESLALDGGMSQAMPSRRDLEQVAKINQRVSTGYEVAIAHLARLTAENERLRQDAEKVRFRLQNAMKPIATEPGTVNIEINIARYGQEHWLRSSHKVACDYRIEDLQCGRVNRWMQDCLRSLAYLLECRALAAQPSDAEVSDE